MSLNLGNIIGTAEDLDAANKSKVYMADLKDIHANSLNYFSINEEEINGLAFNIETIGLLDPLVAFREGGDVVLISGERRYRAMMQLTETGKHYKFNGEDITGKAPVLFLPKTAFAAQELLIGGANAHRDLSPEEKNTVIDRMNMELDKRILMGTFTLPKGQRKAHVLAAMTGIKEHYIKDYLAGKNKPMQPMSKDKDSENGSAETPKKEKKPLSAKAFKKYLTSADEKIGSFLNNGAELSDQDVLDILELLNQLHTTIEYTINKFQQ